MNCQGLTASARNTLSQLLSPLRIKPRQISRATDRFILESNIFLLKCNHLGVALQFCSSPLVRGKPPAAQHTSSLSYELFFCPWSVTTTNVCPETGGPPPLQHIFLFTPFFPLENWRKEKNNESNYFLAQKIYEDAPLPLPRTTMHLCLAWPCHCYDWPLQVEGKDRLLHQLLVHDAVKHRQSIAHC